VLHSLQLEVYSDCIEEVFIEGILSIPKQKARFTHSTIADEQHFEKIIAIHRKPKRLANLKSTMSLRPPQADSVVS